MIPRPHQIIPIQTGIDFLNREVAPTPSIIVAPTAFGKSVLIAKILEQVSGNVLIIQPNVELLKQNHEKFYLATGEKANIYSASAAQKNIGRVTFATIGSIVNIGTQFSGYKMIIDECHLYPRTQESMFGKFIKDANITHVLGLTATPFRLETKFDKDSNRYSKLVMLTSASKEGNFFKNMIYVSQIQEIVSNGFWAKLEYEDGTVLDESLLQMNTTGSDFTDYSIQRTLLASGTNSLIKSKLMNLHDRKKILVFLFSVEEAIAMAEVTPNSAAVYGNMDKKERTKVINDFKNGSLRVIFNVNVLSVGFDSPNIDCIIMARPTASVSWYYQVLGRGTRLSDSKENCLIIDYSGNYKRFGKIEDFMYAKKGATWKMYGRDGMIISGIDVRSIGNIYESVKATDKVDSVSDRAGKTDVCYKIDCIVNFGAHAGKNVSQLPKHYIEWCLNNFDWNTKPKKLKKAMDFHLDRINKEKEKEKECLVK